MSISGPVVALAGGVGGAKLAVGLAHAIPEGALTVVVNTADDLVLHGLHISPDIDTVMYNLAGISNPETGWGIDGDRTSALDLLGRYGGPTWFRLGDKDLATHIRRTQRLAEGARLTEVTRELAASLGIKANILPMTDSPISTRVKTPEGELEFQDYFVARETRPHVCGVRFQGANEARTTPEVLRAFDEAAVIILCPSNPIVSIGPILSISDIHERLRRAAVPRVGVSSIIGGAALRGPAAEMLRSLGHEVSARGVARILRDVLDGFVVDAEDEALVSSIEEMGLQGIALPSIMSNLDTKKKLAQGVLAFASSVQRMA